VSAPLRVLLADDEPVARIGLARMLREDPELEVVAECGHGAEAVRAILALRPDLVLLDVQMPELDGFGVLHAVRPERMPPLIFVTAYDQYAIRAFEVHALDYLLKPFDDARLAEAIARAKRVIREGGAEGLGRRLAALLEEGTLESVEQPLRRLVVRKPDRMVLVPVEEIDWIEAANYCARVHAGGKVHVIREALQRLERSLDPDRFFRSHRSAIVNLDRVREVRPGSRGDLALVLTDGSRVPLSRSRRPDLERVLGQAL